MNEHYPLQLHLLCKNAVAGLWNLAASRNVTILTLLLVTLAVYGWRSPLHYLPLSAP